MARYDADYVPASAMTIFAHPDDAEFGVAGTLVGWARNGCEITMVLCTSGNVGTHDTNIMPETLAETREQEQRAAAAIIGARNLVFLRHDDCQLQPSLSLRRDLVRTIRQHRPEVVICGDPDAWFLGRAYINHPDHRAAGVAAVEAVFPCAEMPLLWPEEGPPHKVGAVYIAWTEQRDVAVDVSDTIDAKIAALKGHASQMGDWDPSDMIRQWAAEDARAWRRQRKIERKKRHAHGGMAKPAGKRGSGDRPRKLRLSESYRVMVLHGGDERPES